MTTYTPVSTAGTTWTLPFGAQLILSCQLLPVLPGVLEAVWFLDRKDGPYLTDLCNGSRDYCLARVQEILNPK